MKLFLSSADIDEHTYLQECPVNQSLSFPLDSASLFQEWNSHSVVWLLDIIQDWSFKSNICIFMFELGTVTYLQECPVNQSFSFPLDSASLFQNELLESQMLFLPFDEDFLPPTASIFSEVKNNNSIRFQMNAYRKITIQNEIYNIV